MRSDNRLEQVAEELLIFAPYATSISQLSEMIKGSRNSVYRAFKITKHLKARVNELLGSKSQEVPPTLTETKKRIVSIPKSMRQKVVSKDEKVSQIKISDIKGDRENEKVVEVELPRTSYQFYKKHHTTHQRMEKSLEICRLVMKGYTVIEACEIHELGKSTFYYWVRKYADIKSMYHHAIDIFKSCQQDEFLFRAYNGLEEKLKSKPMTETTKTGIPDKNGKIKTQSVTQKTYTREPCIRAIFKFLTTHCSDTFGTEREREKAAKKTNYDDVDYSLRMKTDEELEEELRKLDAELKTI